MKCSTCGCDLIGEKLCTQCNTKAEIPSHKFRVEYKDFKVSEMLEIKHEKYEPIEKKK